MDDRFKIVEVDSTASTNTYAATHCTDGPEPVVVITDRQTAGRGQRGNTWESAPGANLTFSLVVYPRWMSASRQFELSMLVSVGIAGGLRPYVPEAASLKVKWPNDIYYGDRKLAGILIENSLSDNHIERSIIGIGLNVNQTEFLSDAPNPVSLRQLTDTEHGRRDILVAVVNNILDMIDTYADDPEVDELTALYNNMLWRNDRKEHTWRMPDGTILRARIDRVDPDGRLHLTTAEGERKSFLFKEIAAEL